MNIELDEVVVQDVSDESLELAAGGAQGGETTVELITLTIGGVSSCCAGNLQPWSLI